MAASPGPIIVTLDPELSCKFPGQSTCFNFGYRLAFRMTSTIALILALTDISAPNNTGDEVQILDVDGGGAGANVSLLANTERIVLVTIGAQNSANGTATLTLVTTGGETLTFTAVISNFHPCDKNLSSLCP